MKHTLSHIPTFILGAALFGFVGIVFAWTGPLQTAPNGNVSAPINVGITDQVKNAGLSVNSLAVFGNSILSGVSRYLNFGATAGSGGYGIRDNAGVMEFKHSGGSWASLVTNTVQGPLTTGTVISTSTTATSTFAKDITVTGWVKATLGFIFPDGTTQATAGAPSTINLHNNTHTNKQCETKNGLVRAIGTGDYLCQMTGGGCPNGWTRYLNWGITHPRACIPSGGAILYQSGSHEFANTPSESVQSPSGGFGIGNCTAAASLEAVGCF